MQNIVSLSLVLFIGLASIGIPLTAHTCRHSGKTRVSVAGVNDCCQNLKDGESCCLVENSFEKLETQSVTFEVNLFSTLSVPQPAVLEPIVVPISISEASNFNNQRQRPPPLQGRALHLQFDNFLI